MTVSAAIYATRTTHGGQPEVRRVPEGATLTLGMGTPVTLTAGFLAEWGGTTNVTTLAGILMEPTRTRTTSGVPQLISPLGVSVANQANAKIIGLPPFDDGKLNIYVNSPDTIFWGQVATAQGGTSLTQANVGVSYGLTKDTTGWYVDTSNTTAGQIVCVIIQLDDFDTRGVFFKFLAGTNTLL